MNDNGYPGRPDHEHTGGYQAPGPYGGPGYGPPPPPGFSDPYQGPHQAYQPPYPPPPGYPPYPGYQPALAKGGAIGALVTSILLVMSCYATIGGIIGLIFSIIAVSENHDQEKVSRFTRYAWIANGVTIGLLVLFFIAVIVAIATA